MSTEISSLIIMATKTSYFLKFLRISHYLVLFTYFSLYFGIKLLNSMRLREKYTNALNTFYSLGVGLVLLSVRFPYIFLDLSDPQYSNDVASLIFSAGIIVLSTISYKNVVDLWNVVTFSSNS